MRHLLLLPLLLLPAACAREPQLRFAVPDLPAPERVSIAFSSLEVRDVSLPSYAQLEEIQIEAEDGAIGRSGLLWADDPVRGASLELVRALGQISGVVVAGEPWPFDPYPAARLEVRMEEFVASRLGAFRVSGQYFVAALDGSSRNGAHLFAITVPLDPEAGAPAIAAARARAMQELALQIAREGLR